MTAALRFPRAWDPAANQAHVQSLMAGAGIPPIFARDDGVRIDATSTFSRELEALIARPFDKKYPIPRYRQFIPVSGEAGPGARTVTHQLWDMVGDAAIVGPEGDDVPLVDVTGEETTSPLVSLGAGYKVTFQDLREAVMTGRPIDSRRAMAARKIVDLRADRLAALGQTSIGLVGLLKHASVPTITPANGTWVLGTTTAAEMLEDLTKLLTSIPVANLDTSKPNTLILGTDEIYILSQTMLGSGSTTTALQALIDNWQRKIGEPFMVESWTRADLANSTDNGPRAMAYRRDGELWLNIPMEFTTYAPQIDGFTMKVLSEMRIGSVDNVFPLEAAYMDGL